MFIKPIDEVIQPRENFEALIPGPGMRGFPEWLKSEGMAHHWAFFSHLDYHCVIRLAPDHWEWTIASIDVTGITDQAREEILAIARKLRSRPVILDQAHAFETADFLSYLSWVLSSPLAHFPEQDGRFLIAILQQTIIQGWTHRFGRKEGNFSGKECHDFCSVLERFLAHEDIPDHYKGEIEKILREFSTEVLPFNGGMYY